MINDRALEVAAPMSRRPTDWCDGTGCVENKKESNKWWAVFECPIGLVVMTHEKLESVAPGVKTALFVDLGLEHKRSDACGEECLQTIFNQWTIKAHEKAGA